MSSDPFIDLLTKLSRSRLRDMESELTAAMQRITFERDIVRRALAEKDDSRREVEATPQERAVAVNGKTKDTRRRSGKREAIRAVMQTDPDRVWMPVEVARRMAERGFDLTADAARVLMRRMAMDKELQRPASGNGFVLPESGLGLDQASVNGSPPVAEEHESQGEGQGARYGSEQYAFADPSG